jgi:hypothetical protein
MVLLAANPQGGGDVPVPEVNSIFHVHHLDAWQGSYSTGPGHTPLPPKKKEPKKDEHEEPQGEGITQDDSGVVHVDVVA